jgi:hypothetical protein
LSLGEDPVRMDEQAGTTVSSRLTMVYELAESLATGMAVDPVAVGSAILAQLDDAPTIPRPTVPPVRVEAAISFDEGREAEPEPGVEWLVLNDGQLARRRLRVHMTWRSERSAR